MTGTECFRAALNILSETPDSGAGTQPLTGDSRQLPMLLAGLLVSAGGIAVLVRKNTARS